MPALIPYQNEEDSISIGALTIENRLDRIALYGSLDLTRDQVGLAQARQLRALADAVVAVLEADRVLPDHVTAKPVETVKNPFG